MPFNMKRRSRAESEDPKPLGEYTDEELEAEMDRRTSIKNGEGEPSSEEERDDEDAEAMDDGEPKGESDEDGAEAEDDGDKKGSARSGRNGRGAGARLGGSPATVAQLEDALGGEEADPALVLRCARLGMSVPQALAEQNRTLALELKTAQARVADLESLDESPAGVAHSERPERGSQTHVVGRVGGEGRSGGGRGGFNAKHPKMTKAIAAAKTYDEAYAAVGDEHGQALAESGPGAVAALTNELRPDLRTKLRTG